MQEKFSKAQHESENLLRLKDLKLADLESRFASIDQEHQSNLQHLDQQRDTTQKRLNIEEQERTMNQLKLDFLVNNNKKLQLQKRFLEKTLDKDLRDLGTEVRKAEIEMQREAVISS